MKIGASLSRCVRDIFDQTVDIYDILVIVARTDFDPEDDKHWNSIWRGYTSPNSWSLPEWQGYEDHEQEFRDICISLKKMGKLHQPRQFGASVARLNHHWYDAILSEDVVNSNPAAKKAWDNYKMIAGLSN